MLAMWRARCAEMALSLFATCVLYSTTTEFAADWYFLSAAIAPIS